MAKKSWKLTWIVGSGPSAAGLDRRKLKKGMIVGVNDVPFHFDCDVFFSIDFGWVTEKLEHIKSLKCEKHLAFLKIHLQSLPLYAVQWERVAESIPTLESGKLAQGCDFTCSGLVAINLAAQMGAKRIILFGYDMNPKSYNYWFGGKGEYPIYDGIYGAFRDVAPWYKAHKIEVLNANPKSFIDAFPKITRQEAYEYASKRIR